MDLKNAATVCLISLFSATLVVLIARSLDSQAASQLEPRLAEIVAELRAMRGQTGIAATSDDSKKTETVDDGLIVYYFHGNIRCPTCRTIESQAKETVQNHFASQLGNGEVAWKIVNYEQASAKPLAVKFDVQMPVVVLARMKEGEILDWKRLDKVWAVVGDKPTFTKYVREEIERMLAMEKPASATQPPPKADVVVPEKTPSLPIPR